ncbi:MAG: GH3 auxin-responsive promoter family protein, partial [Flavobacteriaceae bacterium]|nr:GH3 auxin-responsive promoter family protein [Flavobacteriaceae bacterium]
MAILGNIIKGVIDLKGSLTSEPDKIEEQLDVLKKLLRKAKDTAFGKHYDFEGILESYHIPKAFAEKVPYFDYNKIYEEWWHRLHEGEENITWPDTASYYALSSGTTGDSSKKIPVTDEMIDAIRAAGVKQVFSLTNFDLPSDFFEKEIMML